MLSSLTGVLFIRVLYIDYVTDETKPRYTGLTQANWIGKRKKKSQRYKEFWQLELNI